MASWFTFENMYKAYLDCRRKKRNKRAALAFELNAEENLFALTQLLAQKTYRPSPSFCFVSQNDKYREVFAADFRDRIVHHLLVRYLEKIWEPVFIYDSYACRKGKGTHAAVDRLQTFTRQATANGTRRAWFMQLDVRAFFPSIVRKTLLDLILSRLDNDELRWLSEVVILHDPTQNPVFTCSRRKWEKIPAHKSLFSVPKGQGLPIGNLTSQFFANVYLNALDQFVKHTLKARYYMRYVDDLVFLHEDPKRLYAWKERIGEFLSHTLQLQLHPRRQIVRPVSNGIDFVGYVVRPEYLLVRNRTVARCRESIRQQTQNMTRIGQQCTTLLFPPHVYARLYATLNSYLGIFRHASSQRLIQSLFDQSWVIRTLFLRQDFRAVPRWRPRSHPAHLYSQYRRFRARFRGIIVVQVGCYLELFDRDAVAVARMLGLTRLRPRPGFYARCGVPLRRWDKFRHLLCGRDTLLVVQTGHSAGNVMERVATRIDWVSREG
jgi:retron-type reverse transcriptase